MTAAKSKPVNPYPHEMGAALGVLGVGAGGECHSPCARQLFAPETDSQETLVMGEEGDQPCVPTGPETAHGTNTKENNQVDDNQVGDTGKGEETTKVPTQEPEGVQRIAQEPKDTPPQTRPAENPINNTKENNQVDDNQVADAGKGEETTKVPTQEPEGVQRIAQEPQDMPPQTPPAENPMEKKSPQANGVDAISKTEKNRPARASSKPKAKSKAKAASSKVKAAPKKKTNTKKKHSKTKEKTEEQKEVHRAASKRWHDKWLKKGILKTAKKLCKALNKPSKTTSEDVQAVDKRPAPRALVTKRAKTSSSGSDKGEACELLMCRVFRQTLSWSF